MRLLTLEAEIQWLRMHGYGNWRGYRTMHNRQEGYRSAVLWRLVELAENLNAAVTPDCAADVANQVNSLLSRHLILLSWLQFCLIHRKHFRYAIDVRKGGPLIRRYRGNFVSFRLAHLRPHYRTGSPRTCPYLRDDACLRRWASLRVAPGIHAGSERLQACLDFRETFHVQGMSFIFQRRICHR